MARRLAYRFDLRLYPVDAYGFAHEARATPMTHPMVTYLAGLDFKARMVTATVKQRVEHFVGYASERFDMIVEDLAAVADGPLVLAEGPFLLPELVAPALASTGRAVWLLPTKHFTARNLGVRNEPPADKGRVCARAGARVAAGARRRTYRSHAPWCGPVGVDRARGGWVAVAG